MNATGYLVPELRTADLTCRNDYDAQTACFTCTVARHDGFELLAFRAATPEECRLGFIRAQDNLAASGF